jgi:hypothetical protein
LISGRKRDLSSLHTVETGSATQRDFYPMGSGDSFQGAKRPEPEADHYIVICMGLRVTRITGYRSHD